MTKSPNAMPDAERLPPNLAFDPFEAALRQLFDDMASEPVPDDFMQLVQKLDKTPSKSKPAK